MIKCAVLGSPISHSLSPLLHHCAYEFLGVEGNFEAIDVNSDQLPKFLELAKTSKWSGLALTMPLKEKVLELVDEVDPAAIRIQSANTIIYSGDRTFASSTDLAAFKRIFADLEFNSVAVIGAGGTARAALGALDGRVAVIDLLARNESRRKSVTNCLLQSELNLKNFNSSLEGYDLVISTTPPGVTDQMAKALNSVNGILFDVLYHPWPTSLASSWSQNGGEIIGGLRLLIEQALDQISLMTRIDFSYQDMRDYLNEMVLKSGRI
jgi:shikimate dehydrogenase